MPVKSFSDIVNQLQHTKIDILKMDIEGTEYEVLPGILKSGIEIGQILVEFHHRIVKNGKYLTQQAIKLLKDHNYEIFAVSESSDEVSFIKKG